MFKKAEENQRTQDLYRKAEKIYPRMTKGIFSQFRIISVLLLLGLFYFIPWITWNDRQAILFDLPARKFHMLGVTFWPQDFIYLALLLIIAAFALFFFTSVAGRLWCGFACPQTVWTETFIWIERFVEGERNQRIKLDKASWTINKIRLKATKHFLWGVFAIFTGYTFVGYFTPIKELTLNLIQWELGSWEWFWISLYSLATYGNAGFLREQVCLHMCPYARFQSAMFDENTLIIAYDDKRGETRGHRKKSVLNYRERGLGDCVDCKQCVNVCPTGIDIREGLQYECIACAACVDVCDDVMDQMGYEKGLIRYSTENSMHGRESKILRVNTVLYGCALAFLIVIFSISISFRVPVDLEISRERQRLFIETFEGLIQNIYSVKVANMSQEPHNFIMSVDGIAELELIGERKFSVEAGQVRMFTYRVSVDPKNLTKRSNNIYFTIQSIDDNKITHTSESRFIGVVGSN